MTGGVLRFNSDANLGLAGTGITLNGGSVGTTKDTPAATSIGRDLALAGNGGINVALHPLIWSGNISGAGQLIINGSGELELTGTNTYSGGTRLDGGTLRIASDDKLGAAGTGITLRGGALRASETFTSARAVDLAFSVRISPVDAGKALTLSGIVSGPGILTEVGEGTLILSGANTYTGNIQTNGGTLQGNTTNSLRNNIVFDATAATRSPGPSLRSSRRRHLCRQHYGQGQLYQDRRRHADPERHQQLQHRHYSLAGTLKGTSSRSFRATS